MNAERDAHALACWKANRGSLGRRALSIVLRKEGFNLGRYPTRSLMKRLRLSGRQRRHRYVIAKDINVAKTMTAELALSALRVAKVWRQPKGKVLVHSDQGSQYTGGAWHQYAEDNDIELSQSRRENCWDNAVMERILAV